MSVNKKISQCELKTSSFFLWKLSLLIRDLQLMPYNMQHMYLSKLYSSVLITFDGPCSFTRTRDSENLRKLSKPKAFQCLKCRGSLTKKAKAIKADNC